MAGFLSSNLIATRIKTSDKIDWLKQKLFHIKQGYNPLLKINNKKVKLKFFF